MTGPGWPVVICNLRILSGSFRVGLLYQSITPLTFLATFVIRFKIACCIKAGGDTRSPPYPRYLEPYRSSERGEDRAPDRSRHHRDLQIFETVRSFRVAAAWVQSAEHGSCSTVEITHIFRWQYAFSRAKQREWSRNILSSLRTL